MQEEQMIYIVGIGPGCAEMMTREAADVLEQCDVIVGYTVYVELLKEKYPDKEYAVTPMRREIERCRMCYDLAAQGKKVALVCSGDAGVYGMAAPRYELLEEYGEREGYERISLWVVPGITAANSGAAVLGAPLNHDYCVISLSDLLTPWEQIEKRLRAAVMGDFAMAIYNPSSHKRKDYLKRACEILLDSGAKPDRACGYVENIGRDQTVSRVLTLEELKTCEVNMFTTVFIGNSESILLDGKLITKRGYQMD